MELQLHNFIVIIVQNEYYLYKINFMHKFTENTDLSLQYNQKNILFIESVLRAMKYGSKKASELFPIILQFENLSDIVLQETFLTEVLMFSH